MKPLQQVLNKAWQELKEIFEWTTINSFIKAEIARLEGMKENIKDHHEKLYSKCPRCCEIMARNYVIDEQITHYQQLIKGE